MGLLKDFNLTLFPLISAANSLSPRTNFSHLCILVYKNSVSAHQKKISKIVVTYFSKNSHCKVPLKHQIVWAKVSTEMGHFSFWRSPSLVSVIQLSDFCCSLSCSRAQRSLLLGLLTVSFSRCLLSIFWWSWLMIKDLYGLGPWPPRSLESRRRKRYAELSGSV